MARPKFFRDPVHLQIRFAPYDSAVSPEKLAGESQESWALQRIIDTAAFQRLRGIRQNGLANLVFHGAEHSRFSHSMGVSFMARLMFERICRNMGIPEDPRFRLQVAVASLVHDVGHGPFSHTLEEILKDAGVDFHHEFMTKRMIEEPGSDVHTILSAIDKDLPAEVALFFVKKKPVDHWRYRIVSSQMDADRIDYAHRDALFAGIRGHGFDLERLLDLLFIHNDVSLAVDRGAIGAVEAYLLTMDHLWRSIYYHHGVRTATKMLTSLFRRAVELYRGGRSDVFPSRRKGIQHPFAELVDKGNKVPLSTYCRLTDALVWELMDYWRDHEDFVLSDLSKRLAHRDLLKAVALELTDVEGILRIKERGEEGTRRALGANAKLSEYYLLLDGPDRTSYKTYNWKPESQVESIWLTGGGKDDSPIEEGDQSRLIDAVKQSRRFDRYIMLSEVRDVLRV